MKAESQEVIIALGPVADKPFAIQQSEKSGRKRVKNNFSLMLTSSNLTEKSLIIFAASAEIIKWQLWEEILANLNQMD